MVYENPISTIKTKIVEKPLDQIWTLMQKEYPQAKSIEVHPLESVSSSIAVNTNPEKGTY